jgi:hypothetical protein
VTASGLEKGKKARPAIQQRAFLIFAATDEMPELYAPC